VPRLKGLNTANISNERKSRNGAEMLNRGVMTTWTGDATLVSLIIVDIRRLVVVINCE